MKNSGAITVGTVDLVSSEFRPIIATVGCNSYVFYNDYSLYLRTDSEDPVTELEWMAGQDPSLILGPPIHGRRFVYGSVIIFGKWKTQASGTLKCVFVL